MLLSPLVCGSILSAPRCYLVPICVPCSCLDYSILHSCSYQLFDTEGFPEVFHTGFVFFNSCLRKFSKCLPHISRKFNINSLVHCLEMCHTREEGAAARWWLSCITVGSNQEHYPTQNSWNPCFLACNMLLVHGAVKHWIIQRMKGATSNFLCRTPIKRTIREIPLVPQDILQGSRLQYSCHISQPLFNPLVPLTLILRRSRTGTVRFYTSTSNKRAAQPKLYTKSLTRDLKCMHSRLTLVRISINL